MIGSQEGKKKPLAHLCGICSNGRQSGQLLSDSQKKRRDNRAGRGENSRGGALGEVLVKGGFLQKGVSKYLSQPMHWGPEDLLSGMSTGTLKGIAGSRDQREDMY